MANEIRLFGVTLELHDVVPENLELVHSELETKGPSKSWLIRNFASFINSADNDVANQKSLGLGHYQNAWSYSARVRAAAAYAASAPVSAL